MKIALISFLRNFRKRKVIYSITLIGFGVALAIFVLITSFVIEEKSHDKHLPQISQMYRVKFGERGGGVPKRYYNRIKDQMPEIEKVGMYNKNGGIKINYNDKQFGATYLGMNEECIELFEIKFIRGSMESVFHEKVGIAITESFGKKVYGEENPIGIEIEINDEIRVITAIVNDPPRTFSIKYDFLWHNDLNINMSFWCGSNVPNNCYYLLETAFVLNKNANISEVEKKLNNLLSDCHVFKKEKMYLQKYEEIYFDTECSYDGHEKANVRIMRLLSIVAIIILVLAILNYINLATAANKERFKEICVRKTSGARNRTIISQFILESYISCLISLGIGIIMLVFISSSFNEIFGKEFHVFQALKTEKIILAMVVITILVGGISGIVPAIAASFYNPIKLIQKQSGEKRFEARGIFNSIQFLISISIIICLIFINKQLNYVKTVDVGFNTNQLLYFFSYDFEEHVSTVRDKLYNNPNIHQVCASRGKTFNIGGTGSASVKANGEEFNISNVEHLRTDWNFLNTLDVPLVLGRDFRKSDKNVCLINENFYKDMGWKNLENKFIGENEVIGVFREIHYKSLHKKIGRLYVQYDPSDSHFDYINVKIDGKNIPNTINYMKTIVENYKPRFGFYYQFYDDLINNVYRQEEKQAKAIKIFAIIAILLSCLGLYGMVVFSTTNRIKEIGIRKVNGAKINEILSMLNADFMKWIVIAFVVACPVARHIMLRWLENFAYKTELNWWVFALTGIITVFIALLTISWQSWKMVRKNPVEALRYE